MEGFAQQNLNVLYAMQNYTLNTGTYEACHYILSRLYIYLWCKLNTFKFQNKYFILYYKKTYIDVMLSLSY